jgi:hypothetical protein
MKTIFKEFKVIEKQLSNIEKLWPTLTEQEQSRLLPKIAVLRHEVTRLIKAITFDH